MGCDIHFYVEKKIDGVWTLVYPETLVEIRDEAAEIVEYYKNDPEKQAKRQALYNSFPGKWVDSYEEWDEIYKQKRSSAMYVGRNYNLFAILADVRNGRGFAGVKTGEGFNPIADPKGIPEDASVGYRWEADRWEADGHSHSWFTVQELLDYDWNQTTRLQGWVGPSSYITFKEKGSPDGWCGAIMGPGISHVSNEEMEKYISSNPPKSDPYDRVANVYTLVSWEKSYAECAESFLTETLPALQQLGDPNEVRICFFFDN